MHQPIRHSLILTGVLVGSLITPVAGADTLLGQVIAAQGNHALQQIRLDGASNAVDEIRRHLPRRASERPLLMVVYAPQDGADRGEPLSPAPDRIGTAVPAH